MFRPGRGRPTALLLLLTFLSGGLALPLADAICFHSGTGQATTTATSLQCPDGSGAVHALGCAILTSAPGGRALPAGGAPEVRVLLEEVDQPPDLTGHLPRTVRLAPSLPRAPPSL
jgi:hypothetical protein